MQAQRHAWRAQQATLDPRHTVVVDETGATRAMTRTHGRAPPGERVVDTVPLRHWQVTSLLLALRPDGTQASLSVPAAVDGPVFQTFVEAVLAPALHPGDVVIWDRLQPHQMAGVTAAVERCGARVLPLPPYSPDLCPLDPCFATLKTFLRKVKARTQRAVEAALARGLAALTPQAVKNCFRHCGYRV